MEIHEAAKAFPKMSDEEYAGLREDVREHGVREAIVTYGGQILDGVHRWRASRDVGVPCPTREYMGDDPWKYAISANLQRRHLNESQRAMIANRFATLAHGTNRFDRIDAPIGASTPTQDEAAGMLGVSRRAVQRARKVDDAVPEVGAAVDEGKVSLGDAVSVVDKSPDVQREAVRRVETGEAKNLVAATREINREAKVDALAEFETTLPSGDKRYAVVYADPPWTWREHVSDSRKVQNQYPTMTIDAICEMDVPSICADAAILYLWACASNLDEGLAVMEAWGFEYKTTMVWVKPSIGLGAYVRTQHEVLFIGLRGEFPAPAPADRPGSVVEAPTTDHSAKPHEFYDLIERMHPGMAKVELFARNARDGWDAWGNESDDA